MKEKIESTQGSSFPAAHQVVIYQGKVSEGTPSHRNHQCNIPWALPRKLCPHLQVLKDDTTLEENKISNENFVVVMVTKVSIPLMSQLT